MTLEIVSIAERPDLVPLISGWVWRAFGEEDGAPLDEVHRLIGAATARIGPPQTFVLLREGSAVGTASLVEHDLDLRPDLTPWLANVFVHPDARGCGFVLPLVETVEDAARAAAIPKLWLYTHTAERIYARAGWRRIEDFERHGVRNALMCRDLQINEPGSAGPRQGRP